MRSGIAGARHVGRRQAAERKHRHRQAFHETFKRRPAQRRLAGVGQGRLHRPEQGVIETGDIDIAPETLYDRSVPLV